MTDPQGEINRRLAEAEASVARANIPAPPVVVSPANAERDQFRSEQGILVRDMTTVDAESRYLMSGFVHSLTSTGFSPNTLRRRGNYSHSGVQGRRSMIREILNCRMPDQRMAGWVLLNRGTQTSFTEGGVYGDPHTSTTDIDVKFFIDSGYRAYSAELLYDGNGYGRLVATSVFDTLTSLGCRQWVEPPKHLYEVD